MVAQVSMSSSWLLYLSSVSDEAGDSISKYCALDPAAAFEGSLWGKDGFGTGGAGLVGGGTGAWILAGQGDVPVDTAPPGGPVGTPVARVPGASKQAFAFSTTNPLKKGNPQKEQTQDMYNFLNLPRSFPKMPACTEGPAPAEIVNFLGTTSSS